MGNSLKIMIVLAFALVFLSCTPIKDQQFKNHYLPDLKIKNVEYHIYQHEIVSGEPGHPKRAFIGLLDVELSVTIENIGSGDWNSDLCILCALDENRRQNNRFLLFENLKIPYASKITKLVVLKDLIRRPKTITITLNPQNVDSLECNSFCEGNFYNNNSFKLNLPEKRPNN
jgi:hypothetical protein